MTDKNLIELYSCVDEFVIGFDMDCYRCGKSFKVYYPEDWVYTFFNDEFSSLKEVYSNTLGRNEIGNVCPFCGSYTGRFYVSSESLTILNNLEKCDVLALIFYKDLVRADNYLPDMSDILNRGSSTVDSGLLNSNKGQCRGSIHVGLKRILARNETVFTVVLTSSNESDKDIVSNFKSMIDKLKVQLDTNVEFLAVFTSEGNGVVHVLLNCFGLNKSIIDSLWQYYHSGFCKSCTEVSDIDASMFRIARYYSLGQKNAFIGFLPSDGWYKGGV